RVIPMRCGGVAVLGTVLAALLAWWVVGRAAAWLRGEMPVAHTLYMASHFAMFIAAYLLIPNLDHGWLALSVWHSAQYLLFVWLWNHNRFRAGVDPEQLLLSGISQAHRGLRFYLACFAISTLFFGALLVGLASVQV